MMVQVNSSDGTVLDVDNSILGIKCSEHSKIGEMSHFYNAP
jgi:hypothetical protein